MQIRPATAVDIRTLHDGALPATARAVAVECCGEVLGVGGVYYANGAVYAFTAADERLPRRARVLAGRAVFAIIRSVAAPVWAIQGEFDTAPTVLAHYGFMPVSDGYWIRWPNG